MNVEFLLSATAATASTDQVERIREATGRIMGSVFFGTLLKVMRESTLKGAYGHGGRGEEVFAAQLHGLIAEELGMAMRRGPVAAISKQLSHQAELVGRQAQSP